MAPYIVFNKKMFRFDVSKIKAMVNNKYTFYMTGRILAAVVFVLLTCGKVFSQSITPQDMEKFQIMEDSMVVTSDSMYDAFISDDHVIYSERFAKQLVRALKIPNSYYYPFDKLKDKINIIYSDDNTFRIFNWAIMPTPATKHYYGAIQLPSEKLKLFGLRDYTDELGKGAEDSILTGGKWFGAIYYRIMSHEVEGHKIYTLFGLNSSSPISNKKVLDPLTIDEHGVIFGAPIFGVVSENFPKLRINRFILEYKKEVQVFMNWDQERQVIVFDRLVSQMNDPHRKYTYVPSGEYDGFRWANDMWNYLRDLLPIKILHDGEQPLQDDKPQGNK